MSRRRPLVAAAILLLTASVPATHLMAQQPGSPGGNPSSGDGSSTQGQYPGLSGQQNPLQDPTFLAELRLSIQESGLTPDQIRDRLFAEGYPPDLLDPYLPGASAATTTPPPTDSATSAEVLQAIARIGLVDTQTADSLRGTGRIDSLLLHGRATPQDTVRIGVSDTIPLDDSAALAAARRRAGRRGPYDSLAIYDTSVAGRAMAYDRERARHLVLLRAERDTGLAIFGLSLFERTSTQFQPNLLGPVDDSYRLGPGDQLQLVLTGNVETTRSLTVTRDGFIVIPQVGQISVANLTLGQLTDVLYDRLGRVYSGIRRSPTATTHFSIIVVRLRTNQVYVVGDVVAPGAYQISSAGTAMTALYSALGPSINGSLRSIQIRRGGKTVDSLDVYDYLLRGDASHDVRLQSGDIVFVPIHGPRVKVTGAIVRPAIYELKPGETLRDAIQDAGGFSATASRRRVQITRILPPEQRTQPGHDRVVIDVTADALTAEMGPALPMEPGDSVAVFEIAPRIRNRVVVRGDVWAPGTQGYTEGERLSDAIKLAGGLKPDAYLGQVLITRLEEADSTRVQLRTSFRDSTGVPTEDIALHDDDEILVFSLIEFRPRRYVAIAGAVRGGGRYTYRDGMTLRDLVLLAGGVQESADLQEAEIARLPENRSGGVTATTMRVPLDSTYLFDRGPDGKYLGPPGLPAPRGNAPEVVLHPYDNVLILRQPDWALQRTVVIGGEVRYPGRYTLTTKTERLRSIIERAGGLTPEAYADGIVLFRYRDKTGRIGVDLPRVLQNASDRDNLILMDGDSLYIPLYTGIVKVGGQVNAPTAVAYVPGENMDYYIRAAGGPGVRADMGRAYVTQPDGKIESTNRHLLLFHDVPEPRAGSTVYVPTEYIAPYNPAKLAVYSLIAQVIGSIATILAIARP